MTTKLLEPGSTSVALPELATAINAEHQRAVASARGRGKLLKEHRQ